MYVKTSGRNRNPKLRRGNLVSVDYYKCNIDDDKFQEWFKNNTDEGIGVKVIDYNDEDDLVWIENCPYAIPSWIVYKD